MPFGLTNAPATFQRLVDSLIGPEMEPHAFAYLDDIIIVTETFLAFEQICTCLIKAPYYPAPISTPPSSFRQMPAVLD